MAYALRYYKEFTHADGKVIRLEIHKKDSTTAAVEIGAVVQGLSLQIQGQQGDIDTPIVKTSLSMTFVDAGDIENGQKNGFWEEFYTPDSVLWKVLVKAKKAGGTAFTTIWGGYVTPDSFSESLTYRGSVNIIARDNIGHMQDFPFDAEGDEDGMISLYDLVNTAWAKIESPMSLMWDGGHWMQCEGVNGYNTLMNVSAFEGMSWYEAVEKALYSYGGVMRYIGGNEVLVTTLRYMPTFGRNIDRLPRIEPTFITGATRELVPAVKRVEESVKYDLNKDYQQKIDLIDFSGNVYDVRTDWGTVDDIAWGLMASSPMAPFGWYNEVPYKTLAFNPKAYEIDDTISESDREDIHGNTCILTGTKDDDTYSLSYAMTVGPEDFAINIKFGRFLTRWTNLAGEHSLGFPTNFFGAEYKVRFAVKVVSNGITSYLAQNGEWVEEQATQQVTVTGDSMSVNVPLSGVFTGNVQVSFVFLNVDTGDDAVRILQILGMSLSDISTKPMLETNTVNTNYQEGNNVVLSRDPEIGPAYNTVALPAFIKNGIFRRDGSQILPAYKWGWSGSTAQQMAVYNHLQLLAYYAKPNNLISGTIVNADVTDIACIYEWHHADHILVSGNLNLLNGHIEGAMLREYARYEYLWADVEGAGFPETEQASTTNVEGGASAGGSSSTYTNNTTVNIGSGSSGTGASQLNDLTDVDVTGVVAQSVLYYNGTSWVDMSIHTLLNPYVKGENLNVILTEINAEIEKKANQTALENLTTRVKAEEDITATYKAWWDDLMGLIVKEGSDIKIKTNLIVAGDTSSEGTGESVVSGITGIKLNGTTYKDENNDGIIDLGTITGGLTSVSWSDVQGRPTRVSEFLNDSGYITSAALAGYATQSWVEGKGYITGIDKSMVASAIGASGNAGKVLSSTGGDLGWISLPTSLPASDVYAWAKASTKPSYTTTEVSEGANLYFTNARAVSALSGTLANYLPLSGGTINGTTTSPLKINTTATDENGINFLVSGASKAWIGYSSSTGAYIYEGSSAQYICVKNGTPYYGSTSSLKTLIHSGNIGSQHVAGLIKSDGNAYVSYNATYGYANINGVAIGLNSNTIERVTSGKLYIQKNITEATIINQYGGNVGVGTDNPAYKLDVQGGDINTSSYMHAMAYKTNGDYGIWKGSTFTSALSATDLALYGTKIYCDGAVTMSSTLSVNGEVAIQNVYIKGISTNPYIRFTLNGGNWYCQAYTTNGVDGIFLGSASTKSLKVDVNGNVYCPLNLIVSGDTATGSDIRFKDRIADHRIALSDIAEAPLFTFKWNDREDKTEHLGTSAQYWEGVAPWLVKGTDFKVLDYSTLGVAIGISLANKTLNIEDRVKILEKENKALKEQIRRIQYGS